MRFKPGQQVVCVNDGGWDVTVGKGISSESGPKHGDIVTVHSYATTSKNFIGLVEWRFCSVSGLPQFFPEKSFAPLADISELKEILKYQPGMV